MLQWFFFSFALQIIRENFPFMNTLIVFQVPREMIHKPTQN